VSNTCPAFPEQQHTQAHTPPGHCSKPHMGRALNSRAHHTQHSTAPLGKPDHKHSLSHHTKTQPPPSKGLQQQQHHHHQPRSCASEQRTQTQPSKQRRAAEAAPALVNWCTGAQTTPLRLQVPPQQEPRHTQEHRTAAGSHSTACNAPTRRDAFHCNALCRKHTVCCATVTSQDRATAHTHMHTQTCCDCRSWRHVRHVAQAAPAASSRTTNAHHTRPQQVAVRVGTPAG
jgi:hypothetical protein